MTHKEACKAYKESFYEEHGYLWCELCGVSNSFAFSTHHIVYASEAPKHTKLHDPRNLILLCHQCHKGLHDKKSLRNDLVKKRDLCDLFNRSLMC